MPKKTSSTKSAKTVAKAAAKPKAKKVKAAETVMWVRLPQSTTVEGLKKLGIKGAACYGGDTCIAATEMNPEAGIIVKPDVEAALKRAGFAPKSGCYGGDTCIV